MPNHKNGFLSSEKEKKILHFCIAKSNDFCYTIIRNEGRSLIDKKESSLQMNYRLVGRYGRILPSDLFFEFTSCWGWFVRQQALIDYCSLYDIHIFQDDYINLQVELKPGKFVTTSYRII